MQSWNCHARGLLVTHSPHAMRFHCDGQELQPGAVVIGDGQESRGPFGRHLETDDIEPHKEAADKLRDWLIKGPRSEHWAEGDPYEWGLWAGIIEELPNLRGKKLVDTVPLHLPSPVDVLAELANGDTMPCVGLVWAAIDPQPSHLHPCQHRASTAGEPAQRLACRSQSSA